ncbi:MAG: hypothetical protein IT376_05855 [Polyangiaceae bacterium]|nr:hypothetical protein [Polyangiaceae bacterium]
MTRIRRLGALSVALGVAACAAREPAPVAEARLVVAAPIEGDVALDELKWTPPGAARIVRAGREVELAVRPAAAPGGLVLGAPGACPRRWTGTESAAEERVRLVPAFGVRGGDLAQLGYGAPFELRLVPGCDEARAAHVTWRVTSGATIDLTAAEDGHVARGRLPDAEAAGLRAPPWGLAPISPRSRGEITLEASWELEGVPSRRTVRVAAAARASGLPSVAVGQRLWLAGAGWRVQDRPPRAAGGVAAAGSWSALVPDERGRWTLVDASGRALSIVVGRHAETPLDCGRSECHHDVASAATGTRMATTFHDLLGRLRPSEPACALGCHAVGEPGLADGGFAHVLASLGAPPRFETGPAAWDALPRPLRRLGGVGCTACHGPGAIPEPSASWAILRADVCAVCHDAPPRYTHVEGWARSKMATADRDPATREPACRGCHGTAGYLARITGAPERELPPGIATGIACAACHAPHGAHAGELIRDVASPTGGPAITDAASRLCASCHSDPSPGGPRASAATLVHGAAPGATPPHAAVPGGCLGCHGDGDAATTTARGHGHAFAVDRSRCATRCHVGAPPLDDRGALARRARELYRSLGGEALAEGTPPHARRRAGAPSTRALEAVRLVLEDPAAWAHNAPYARALLEGARPR